MTQHFHTGFGIGQSVSRPEDERLAKGEGRFTDDVNLPGQVYAKIIRSQYAHGVIRGVDVTEARTMPGVLAAYSGADLASANYARFGCKLPLTGRDGAMVRQPLQAVVAIDRVRHVGDPLGFVVAGTEQAALDAAEAVMVDIDPLPAVTGAREAEAPSAPQLYDDVPRNVAVDYMYGDPTAVADAFATAAHVTRVSLVNNRVVVNAMEPRAALAEYDAASDRYTLHVGCQGVFGMRAQLADVMRIPVDKLRVLTGNVGGSFGLKASVFSEYVFILHAAKELGRPVKWTASRTEGFVSDHHGRDQDLVCELALDANGLFLAVRVEGAGNIGAYCNHFGPVPATGNVAKNMIGPYRTPLIEVATRAVFTNTVPVGPYRGAGRPEGNYNMQRLIDQAAFELGIDPVELRRRNLIAPGEMPYAASSGMTYDSGDFEALMDEAVHLADWDGFAARRQESAARGMLRGRGIGQYLEVTAAPSNEMAGIRFETDGLVTIVTGTLDYGQGHLAPFAQVLVDRLGVPFDKIRLAQGDSDQLIAGGGTGGSRSIMASGNAIVGTSREVVARGKRIAAAMLETNAETIDFADGIFRATGTNRSIGIMDMARRLNAGEAVPEGCPHSLSVDLNDGGMPSTFPNGCHIAEIEIDPATGIVSVVRYTGVDDFGTIVNPMLVEGQMHGGVTQGIGQALMEATVYGDNGQLLAGSFMDYAMPRADDVPLFTFASHAVPATTNTLGVKGCGEAGCAGSITSVMSAVMDALRPLGVRHIDMPATPEKVWRAIRDAA